MRRKGSLSQTFCSWAAVLFFWDTWDEGQLGHMAHGFGLKGRIGTVEKISISQLACEFTKITYL